jgi:hypothetical protein
MVLPLAGYVVFAIEILGSVADHRHWVLQNYHGEVHFPLCLLQSADSDSGTGEHTKRLAVSVN